MVVFCPAQLPPLPLAGLPTRAAGASKRAARLQVACTTSLHGSGSPLELPGGRGVWLGRDGSSSEMLLFGQEYGFVLRRQKLGGEGLVVRRPGPKPVRRQEQAKPGQLVPRRSPAQQQGLSLAGLPIAGCSVVIDTDFEIMEVAAPPPVIEPNTSCTGLILVSTPQHEEETDGQHVAGSRHPRRTRRVTFTCNLCGTSNTKDTNPHAWNAGSVFMRCEGCSAVHKIKDNLRIFHELQGPVFPPRNLRSSFLNQELLDRLKRMTENDDGILN